MFLSSSQPRRLMYRYLSGNEELPPQQQQQVEVMKRTLSSHTAYRLKFHLINGLPLQQQQQQEM